MFSKPISKNRGVFLDISKAFKTMNRVWHDESLFNLKENGFNGNLFQLIISFLNGTFQRVLLNGPVSDWEIIRACLPLVLILGSLFFLKYINDLTNDLKISVKPFTDDTSLSSETANILNNNLRKIRKLTKH